MEKIARFGMDTSNYVFQLHGVEATETVVLRRKLRRTEMLAFIAAARTDRDWHRGLRKVTPFGGGSANWS